MVGTAFIGDNLGNTHKRFRNVDDFEICINSINDGYDSQDAIFKRHFYKLNTSQFYRVNRSRCGNACDLKQETIEYQGNNCFIPTEVYCLIKCINCSTKLNYKQQYSVFTRNEDKRGNNMTMARSQPCFHV